MIKYFCDKCDKELENYDIFIIPCPEIRTWDDDARTGYCILCRSCLDKFENWVSRPQTECVKVGKWYSFTDYVVEMQGDNKPKEFRIMPQTDLLVKTPHKSRESHEKNCETCRDKDAYDEWEGNCDECENGSMYIPQTDCAWR